MDLWSSFIKRKSCLSNLKPQAVYHHLLHSFALCEPWEIQQFQRKVDTCVIGSLLCYKKCSRAEQSLATLRGESKISCAASVNNKPTFSPCSFISRWKSHSCSLLWSRDAQSKCLGDASPLLVLGVDGPEQAGEAARDSVHGDDDVASQRSASACPRAERSSWKKKVSVTVCLRLVSVVAGMIGKCVLLAAGRA
jgi:hypothetical protein